MVANDTVMGDEELRVIWKEMYNGSAIGQAGVAKNIAKAQAKISFKAGIKEVVDTFHDDVCNMADRFPTAKELTDFINKWQAKLKGWGVK